MRFTRSFILALAIFIFITTGLYGIDYGDHVDEPRLLNSIAESMTTGTLLPDWYNYPSVSYTIGVWSMLPYTSYMVATHPQEYSANSFRANLEQVGESLPDLVDSHDFRLYLRGIFLLISTLAIFWTYYSAFSLRQNLLEAIFAAVILAGSWEFNYQARYIAPDALMMQFGILTILCLLKFLQNPRRAVWLVAATVSAGLATGTKYQAGLFFGLVILIYWLTITNDVSCRVKLIKSLSLSAIFGGVFLLTTPGAVLQPIAFLHHVGYEINHYSTGHHVHTVSPGLTHLNLIGQYLIFEFPSNYVEISVAISILAIAGAGVIIWQHRTQATLLVAFPLFYILYMSTQQVMFIRNLMVIFPFIAIWGGVGLNSLIQWLSPKFKLLRLLFIAGFAIMALLNSFWLIEAAHGIKNPTKVNEVTILIEHVQKHANQDFHVSPQVREALTDEYSTLPPNIISTQMDGQQIVIYVSELKAILAELNRPYLINRSNFYTFLYPQIHTNTNYFDAAPQHIVILSRAEYEQLIGTE